MNLIKAAEAVVETAMKTGINGSVCAVIDQLTKELATAKAVMGDMKPVAEVVARNGYWSGCHFHEGGEPYIYEKRVSLPIGTKLYAAPQPAWRSLDSAPKDGTPIFAKLPDSNSCHSIRWKSDIGCWVICWDHYQLRAHDEPTEWMPIP